MPQVKTILMFAVKVWVALLVINIVTGFLPQNIQDFLKNPLNK